jgi:hypothetical protein
LILFATQQTRLRICNGVSECVHAYGFSADFHQYHVLAWSATMATPAKGKQAVVHALSLQEAILCILKPDYGASA